MFWMSLMHHPYLLVSHPSTRVTLSPFRHPGEGRDLAGALPSKVEIPAFAGMTGVECVSTSLDANG
jgi:hypothetical protein